MRNLITLISVVMAILLPLSSLCQLDTVYYGKDGYVARSKKKASFYLVINRHAPDVIEVHEFLIGGRLRKHQFYSSEGPWLEHGYSATYYDNGNLAYEGYHENGSMTGKWKNYFKESGKLEQETDYNIRERKREIKSYHANGRLKRHETRIGDEPATGHCYDSLGNEIRFFPYEVMPVYKYDINDFLSKSIIYPKYCQKNRMEGKVIIAFEVDASGKMHEMHLVKSVHPLLDREAMRVARKMNSWTPGLRENVPAAFTYHLPINFKLQ